MGERPLVKPITTDQNLLDPNYDDMNTMGDEIRDGRSDDDEGRSMPSKRSCGLVNSKIISISKKSRLEEYVTEEMLYKKDQMNSETNY